MLILGGQGDINPVQLVSKLLHVGLEASIYLFRDLKLGNQLIPWDLHALVSYSMLIHDHQNSLYILWICMCISPQRAFIPSANSCTAKCLVSSMDQNPREVAVFVYGYGCRNVRMAMFHG